MARGLVVKIILTVSALFPQRVQLLLHLHQKPAHFLQGVGYFDALLELGAALAHQVAGTGDGVAALLYQMVNCAERFDVLGRVEAVALLVLARAQVFKLGFPEPNQRGRHVEHAGYFADGVVLLLNLALFVGHK